MKYHLDEDEYEYIEKYDHTSIFSISCGKCHKDLSFFVDSPILQKHIKDGLLRCHKCQQEEKKP